MTEEPTAVLRHEHEAIEHLLDALDGIARALDGGVSVPRADVESALDVIVGFADKCHHAKEERVVFSALADEGRREGLLLVRELEGDHEAGRALVRSMRALAGAGEGSSADQRRDLAREARDYTKMLRAHIERETTRLFPLVDSIPAIRRAELADEFERVEREETGAGAHERFERDIHALHERWATPHAHA